MQTDEKTLNLNLKGAMLALELDTSPDMEELDEEQCPGCGNYPGDGLSDDCFDEEGCGFWRACEREGKKHGGFFAENQHLDDTACPGCGCQPGDGTTKGCTNPDGCGFAA